MINCDHCNKSFKYPCFLEKHLSRKIPCFMKLPKGNTINDNKTINQENDGNGSSNVQGKSSFLRGNSSNVQVKSANIDDSKKLNLRISKTENVLNVINDSLIKKIVKSILKDVMDCMYYSVLHV